MRVKTIPVETLRNALSYDEGSGELRWKHARGSRAKAGAIAGHIGGDGYRVLRIDSVRLYCHRVIWAIVHGEWPPRQIDHIDGNRLNNRISNLRSVSCAENHQNIRRPLRNGSSGFLGAAKGRGGYRALITVDGVTHYLGMFPSAQEAHAAYVRAKRRLHPAGTL